MGKTPAVGSKNQRLEEEVMPEKVMVAKATKVGRKPVCVEHQGVPYCVVRDGAGIRAYVSVCSHKRLAMFPPERRKGMLVCPFHEACFDAGTGKNLKGKGKKADDLKRVKVKVVDGVVHIEARKRHRKLLPKSERRWVAREAGKLSKKKGGGK